MLFYNQLCISGYNTEIQLQNINTQQKMFSFNQNDQDQNTPFFQDNEQKPSLFNTQFTQQPSAFQLFNSNQQSLNVHHDISFNAKDNGRQSKKSIIMELDQFNRKSIFKQLESNIGQDEDQGIRMDQSRVVKFQDSQNQREYQYQRQNRNKHNGSKDKYQNKNGFGKFKIDLGFNKNKQVKAESNLFDNMKLPQNLNIKQSQNVAQLKMPIKNNKEQKSKLQNLYNRQQFSFQIKPSKQKLENSHVLNNMLKISKNQGERKESLNVQESKQDKMSNFGKSSLLNKLQVNSGLEYSKQKQIGQPQTRVSGLSSPQVQLEPSIKSLSTNHLNPSAFQFKIKENNILRNSNVGILNFANRQKDNHQEKTNLLQSQLKAVNVQSKNITNININNQKQEQEKVNFSKKRQDTMFNIKSEKASINFAQLFKKSGVKDESKSQNVCVLNKDRLQKEGNSNQKYSGIKMNMGLLKNIKNNQQQTNQQQKNQQKSSLNLPIFKPQIQNINTFSIQQKTRNTQIFQHSTTMVQDKNQKIKQKPFLNLKIIKDQMKTEKNQIADKKSTNNLGIGKESRLLEKRDGVFTAQMFKDSNVFGKGLNFQSLGGKQDKKEDKNQSLLQPKERVTQKVIKMPCRIEKNLDTRHTQKLNISQISHVQNDQDSPHKAHRIDYESIENELINLYEQMQQTKRKSLKSDESIKSIFLLLNKANITLSQRFMSQIQNLNDDQKNK